MILIFSDEHAGQILEEVGQLQRQIEAGQGLDVASQEVSTRARAVIEYFLSCGSTNVFKPLVEPLMQWGIYSLAPKFLTDESLQGKQYRAVYDAISSIYADYKHLAS